MTTLKKPLRENVALAIDGGGIRGVMVTRALMYLEQAEGVTLPHFVDLSAGTSTGAIIAAGIAMGMDASTMHDLYLELGQSIFRKTWRNLPLVKLLVRYQYSSEPLVRALREHLGDITIGKLRRQRPEFNLVLTATDIYAHETRFIKLYKRRYADWMLRDAVMASSIVPTVFPVFAHAYTSPDNPAPLSEAWIPEPRYWVDGGVGSYSNPCYMAAYEIAFCLRERGWRLDNTTLISIGTGKSPAKATWADRLDGFRRTPARFVGPEWAFPTIDTFIHDANAAQVRLVKHFFVDAVAERAGSADAALDFRRYNIEFDAPIGMDDAAQMDILTRYGDRLGQMIVNDEQEDVGSFACGITPHAFRLRSPGDDRSQAV